MDPGIRFEKGERKWFILALTLPPTTEKRIKVDFVWIDSTTLNLHRHGWGSLKKRDPNVLEEVARG